MVAIALKLQAFPEKRQELMQTLKAIMDKTLVMKDCGCYTLHQDPEDLNTITLMMEWKSLGAFHSYQQSEHFGVLLGAFNLLCSSKQIQYDTAEK